MAKSNIDATIKNRRRKRAQRKAAASIIILFLFAVFLFFLGWRFQLQLEENSYAVLFSKTSGYHEEVLRPGHFYWFWEGLLPTNTVLHQIGIENQNSEIRISGNLPSGKLYADYLGIDETFNYLAIYNLSYQIDPDRIYYLITEQGLSQESLPDFYNASEKEFESFLQDQFLKNITSTTTMASTNHDLLTELGKAYPDYVFQSLTVKDKMLPDVDLYNKAKLSFLDFIETKEQIQSDYEQSMLPFQEDYALRMKVLEDYGELLTKYPVLLEMFKLGIEPDYSLLPQQ